MLQVSYALEVPQMLVASPRLHNAFCKRALRAAIEYHHERRIPLHFQRAAHGKYGYAERSKRYRVAKQKKYGSSLDLVRTGATMRKMTRERQLSIGGQASSSGLRATLRLRFPFPADLSRGGVRKDGRPKITAGEMVREIEAITPDELAEIQRQINDVYLVLVDTDASARQRVKVT